MVEKRTNLQILDSLRIEMNRTKHLLRALALANDHLSDEWALLILRK